MNRSIALASGMLLLAVAGTAWYSTRGPRPVALTPTLTGQTEYCLTCHGNLDEISASHPVATFGCVRCHGGERLALDADLAHSSLRGASNPSAPAVWAASCGGSECHSGPPAEARDHLQRVATSLRSTYAGALAAMRFAEGAQPDLVALAGIHAAEDDRVTTPTGLTALAAFDPAHDTAPGAPDFAAGCLFCHLAAEPLPGLASARFTGCAACHAITAGKALSVPVHRLTTAVSFQQCNTCHNRGTYDVASLSFQPRADEASGRVQAYYLPGTAYARCEVRLDCVDCHTRTEIMGDGDLHSGMQEVEYVQCRTCHGTSTELPATRTITDPADIALRMTSFNPAVRLQLGDTVIVTAQGEPLWNTRRSVDGSFELIAKVSGQHYRIPLAAGSGCRQLADAQKASDCHACHSAEH